MYTVHELILQTSIKPTVDLSDRTGTPCRTPQFLVRMPRGLVGPPHLPSSQEAAWFSPSAHQGFSPAISRAWLYLSFYQLPFFYHFQTFLMPYFFFSLYLSFRCKGWPFTIYLKQCQGISASIFHIWRWDFRHFEREKLSTSNMLSILISKLRHFLIFKFLDWISAQPIKTLVDQNAFIFIVWLNSP